MRMFTVFVKLQKAHYEDVHCFSKFTKKLIMRMFTVLVNSEKSHFENVPYFV